MKKLILLITILVTVSFTACKKENVQPQHTVTTLATSPSTPPDDGDKGDLGQADGDKGDLGQADGD